jgi:signal transduction histidine kinase/HPt (histidine-containing phosphotransfer) domain-containing protein/ActR/RegA family two-component response regulator
MAMLRSAYFGKSMKGKILLGFFIAVLALAASWLISNVAFNSVLTKLDVLSKPNRELELVHSAFKNIIKLNNLENERSSTISAENRFEIEHEQLVNNIDSLAVLLADKSAQVIRLDSMKQMLLERQQIFNNYVKVRSNLVDNEEFEGEVQTISGLLSEDRDKPDSTIVKTERRVTTTTVLSAPTVTPETEEKKGIFNKIFGSKKNKKGNTPATPTITQKEVIDIQVDTLRIANIDSTIQKVGHAVEEIKKSQQRRTNRFVNHEQVLSQAGNKLVRQLLRVMQDIEQDIVKQSREESAEARTMVSQSIGRLELIMIGFFFVIAILAYLIFADISKSNEYRIALEEAKDEAEYHSMAKQRFLSNISHEIRTPLQSIIGYAETLTKAKNPKKQDLETLHSAAEHLLYLVNDVLDYSRIVSDQFNFEVRPFSISLLLEDVIKMLRPTAESKSLALHLENSLPTDLHLYADPFRLRQILYNLLSNALKFTEVGQVVLKIQGEEVGPNYKIEFQVIDSGIGLTEEQIHRVFKQFEQADASIARRYGGTGLGLSIVDSLVNSMGGNIHVQSEIGVGTTFIVTLEFEKSDPVSAPISSSEALPIAYHGKVWLIDDDPFILKWCSSIMESQQVDYKAFSSAEAVLQEKWDPEVNLVLTDMRMPGMSGIDLAHQLRKKATQPIRIYVVTAQALPEERENLLQHGFDGLLMKPFPSSELIEILKYNQPDVPIDASFPEKIDLTKLTEMTFGDEGLLKEILHQFISDTKNDLTDLKNQIDQDNKESIMEIMHKLAGRTGQVGLPMLAMKFRDFEIELREDASEVSLDDIRLLQKEASEVLKHLEQQENIYSI